jgi:FHA domain
MTDFVRLAAVNGRDEFVALCPFPFLVGKAPQPPSRRQHNTMGVETQPWAGKTQGAVVAVPKPSAAPPIALPVRKIQSSFPTMITVGRTPNNDVLIEDLMVSKFHAHFRISDEGVELTDAGSKNGSWLNGIPLVAKTPVAVQSGDVIRFAQVALKFLSSGDAWHELQKAKR